MLKMDHYKPGVLNEAVHGRLVQDIDAFARDAAIQPSWISRPLSDTCSPQEVAWVKRYKYHSAEGCSGLVYVGKSADPEVEDRMAAIAGALVRNFIRARVYTVSEVVQAHEKGGLPDVSCVLIPNFFVGKAKAETAGWRVSSVLDALMSRRAQGLQTVIYVTDLADLSTAYGDGIARHVRAHYTRVDV